LPKIDKFMATLIERLHKWKETRTVWQKAGDILFWMLLVLLVIPGPRKVISTTVNRLALLIKSPGMMAEEKQISLSENDFNWRLQNREGELFTLQTVKGQPVFLNFWATWCPPCVAELPEIQRTYQKHWESVAFLLVTNQEPGVVEAFLDKHGYELPVVYAASPTPGVFEHGSIPTTYIISPEGLIVVRKTGAVNWDSKGTDRIFKQLIR
jgi:thiol-disulfide isomerase/thioredoxin